jgi:hypothetical protein
MPRSNAAGTAANLTPGPSLTRRGEHSSHSPRPPQRGRSRGEGHLAARFQRSPQRLALPVAPKLAEQLSPCHSEAVGRALAPISMRMARTRKSADGASDQRAIWPRRHAEVPPLHTSRGRQDRRSPAFGPRLRARREPARPGARWRHRPPPCACWALSGGPRSCLADDYTPMSQACSRSSRE